MPTLTRPWPATCAAAALTSASARRSKTPPGRWPEREETDMRIRGIEALAGGQAGNSGEARPTTGVATLDRRSFLKLTGLAGGGLALGVAPLAQAQEGARPKAPPAAPQAFLII